MTAESLLDNLTSFTACKDALTRALCFLICWDNRLRLFAGEEFFDRVDGRASPDRGDGLGQRDALWTDLHTVLSVAAVLDAVSTHQDFHAFVLETLSGAVLVKEAGLGDRLWPDEIFIPVFFVFDI